MNLEDDIFAGCTSLVKLVLPNSIKKIPAYMCEGCRRLEEITIPETVEIIGKNAFDGCKAIKSIKIPKGVKKINEYAFWDCTGLKDVYMSFETKTYGWVFSTRNHNGNGRSLDCVFHFYENEINNQMKSNSGDIIEKLKEESNKVKEI